MPGNGSRYAHNMGVAWFQDRRFQTFGLPKPGGHAADQHTHRRTDQILPLGGHTCVASQFHFVGGVGSFNHLGFAPSRACALAFAK